MYEKLCHNKYCLNGSPGKSMNAFIIIDFYKRIHAYDGFPSTQYELWHIVCTADTSLFEQKRYLIIVA